MRNTLANAGSVVAGELFLRLANFVAAVLIARLFGAAMLGVYATVLAFATLVGRLGDNGMNLCGVAEGSRRPKELDLIVTSLYATKTAFYLVALSITVPIATAVHISAMAWVVGSLIFGKVIINSYGQLNFGILKALGRMRVIGLIQLVHAAGIIGGMILAYREQWSVESFLILLLAGQVGEIGLSGAVLWHLGVRVARPPLSECWRLVMLSTPLGLAGLLSTLMLRTDVLAISWLYSPVAVGHFAAADNGIVAVYAAATLFGTVLLPEMIKAGRGIEEYTTKWIRLLCAVCIPATLAVELFATRLAVLVYGKSFSEAGALIGIMAPAALIIMLNAVYLSRTIALQQTRTYLAVYGGAALLTVVLDLILGRSFGSVGVAAAIVIRETVMLTVFAVSARGIRRTTFAESAVVEP